MTTEEFAARYGPWALIVGASEGVGEALARRVAARGLNVALLARRQEVLDELAASVRRDHGVEARALAIDLAVEGAVPQILAATAGLDVGFLAYCAGADPNYAHFLDQSLDDALSMVRRNCLVP